MKLWEKNFEINKEIERFTVRRDEKTHRERIQYMSFTATVSYADHDRIVVALPNSGRIADLQRSEETAALFGVGEHHIGLGGHPVHQAGGTGAAVVVRAFVVQ